MIIDFHTHTFPEKIAARAIASLSGASHSRAMTDGTEEGLLRHMAASGVTHSVILPVATAARQVISINDASARLNEARREQGLISLGAMHPEFEDVRGELTRLRDLGFRGIKIHPIYQGTDLDAPAFLRILETSAELGLLVVTHAGDDIGFPGVVHASPAMSLSALREIGFSPSRPVRDAGSFRLILAHMGGWKNWEEVETLAPELLAAGPVMIDTAFSTGTFPALPDGYWKEEQTHMLETEAFVRIIKTFGAEKVLFGSDSPWASQTETLTFIRQSPLTQKEKTAILHQNAATLLGLAP